MENYIENTDLINAYLNNTLSKTERQAFKNRVDTDLEFKELYNEQLAILEGINRIELKSEISAAKQSYVRAKWMKYIGIPVAIFLVSALVYNFIFKNETSQIVEPINTKNNIEFVSDSINIEKPFEEKIEEIAVVEQSENELISKEIKEKNEEIATSKKTTRNDIAIQAIVEEEATLKDPEPMPQELVSFYKSVKKAPQIIEVNTEKDFTVTCKEGTTLTIPAKSFLDKKTGKLARGKVNLEVTEYYKLSDMLLANLSTKSNDEILETGGMLHLGANKKGAKLKLKSGKRIKIAFNNKGKENMQLFNGEARSDGVNWRLQNNETKSVVEFLEEDVEVSMAVIEEPPLFPGCDEMSNRDEIIKCLSDNLSNYMRKNYDVSVADDDASLTGIIKMSAYFNINKTGRIDNIIARAPTKKLGDEIIRVLESLPVLEPGMQRGKIVSVPFYLPVNISKEGKTKTYDALEVRSVPKIEMSRDSVRMNTIVKSHPRGRLVNYAFASANLGWINCDRFVRSKAKKVKVKLKIKDPKGTTVKMVFKSISAILPSKKYADEFDFGRVPIGEEVILIAVKKTNDKLFLAKKEMKIKLNPDLSLDFKEVTFKELKSELRSLNSSF